MGREKADIATGDNNRSSAMLPVPQSIFHLVLFCCIANGYLVLCYGDVGVL